MEQLIIKKSTIKGAGNGVFTTVDIKKGDTIEICETMIFNEKQAQVLINETQLGNYVFAHEDGKSVILVWGKGSMYNHKSPSNAQYYFDDETNQMSYVAVKDIPAGKEIFINYGGEWNAKYVVDFYEYPA